MMVGGEGGRHDLMMVVVLLLVVVMEPSPFALTCVYVVVMYEAMSM